MYFVIMAVQYCYINTIFVILTHKLFVVCETRIKESSHDYKSRRRKSNTVAGVLLTYIARYVYAGHITCGCLYSNR